MISLDIPGKGKIEIKHLVLDVNGTLAVDGTLLPGVADLLGDLGGQVAIHLLTADTHGKQEQIDHELGLKADRIQAGGEARQKAQYIAGLGAEHTAAVGQGANDSLMLKEAAVGICVLSPEGTALETLLGADLVLPDIESALTCLLKPTRLIASLRA